VIDLVEDQHSHKLYALKRMTCHSREDEKNAVLEAELMTSVHHRCLVPSYGHSVVPLSGHRTAISEVLIVMPYYRVQIIAIFHEIFL
jgi:serine/threonine kinase 16